MSSRPPTAHYFQKSVLRVLNVLENQLDIFHFTFFWRQKMLGSVCNQIHYEGMRELSINHGVTTIQLAPKWPGLSVVQFSPRHLRIINQ